MDQDLSEAVGGSSSSLLGNIERSKICYGGTLNVLKGPWNTLGSIPFGF